MATIVPKINLKHQLLRFFLKYLCITYLGVIWENDKLIPLKSFSLLGPFTLMITRIFKNRARKEYSMGGNNSKLLSGEPEILISESLNGVSLYGVTCIWRMKISRVCSQISVVCSKILCAFHDILYHIFCGFD